MTNKMNLPLVSITSLGCSKNWVDTEIAAAALLQAGFGYAPDERDADIRYINTCGFIASARKEASDFIAKAVRWKKREPELRRIVVAGCIVASRFFDAFKEKFPEVDLWIAPDDAPRTHEKFAQLLQNKIKLPKKHEQSFIYDHETPRIQLTPEHFAYIKISDGCDNHCSYCAIPSIRGKNRSRTIASVCSEIRDLAQLGVKEFILIGQDITRFGMDREGGETLMQLLYEIEKIPGDFWVRMLYLHPARYPEELTQLFKSAQHLIPYLEMPIQHISEHLLESMNRKVSGARIRDIFATLRKKVPHIALRTTFIVGYPGETDADFQEILDLMKSVRFDRVGAFIFQPEPDTPAATMKNTVSASVAKARYNELMALQNEISLTHNKALVGSEIEVLIDALVSTSEGDYYIGRTYRDAPEIDNTIYIKDPKSALEIGERVKVKITRAEVYDLYAKLLPASKKGNA